MMLLKTWGENNEALMQMGREAIAEYCRLGLSISAEDLESEAKECAETDHS